MSSSYVLGVDRWVRISPAIALRSTDAPAGTGRVTGVDGDRRLVKWPNGFVSWHGVWILAAAAPPYASSAEPPQETDDADDADLAAAVWRVGEQLAKISGQFEALMAAMAQAAQVLGPVLAVVVEKLESLPPEPEPETPCMDAFESSDGWYHCTKPTGHGYVHADGPHRWVS